MAGSAQQLVALVQGQGAPGLGGGAVPCQGACAAQSTENHFARRGAGTGVPVANPDDACIGVLIGGQELL